MDLDTQQLTGHLITRGREAGVLKVLTVDRVSAETPRARLIEILNWYGERIVNIGGLLSEADRRAVPANNPARLFVNGLRDTLWVELVGLMDEARQL